MRNLPQGLFIFQIHLIFKRSIGFYNTELLIMNQKKLTRKTQLLLGFFFSTALLILLAAAACVPFYFESQSLYYKLGTDKTLLQAGKVFGLVAMILILTQVVLVSRFAILEKVFSLKSLFSFHRTGGKIITVLILLHPLCILAAESFILFPFEPRYWPEFLGIGLAVLILGIVLTSVGQKRLRLPVKTWQTIHRIGTLAIVILAFIHVFFVSESFDLAVPKAGIAMAAGFAALLFSRLYYKRYVPKSKL